MWSCELSVDKEYATEYARLVETAKSCKHLIFAEEESMSRLFLYVSSHCDYREEVQSVLENAICDALLIGVKRRYFLSRVHYRELSHSLVALLSSLICFDRAFEESVVRRVLSESATYALDGILNFRLSQLTDNWKEMCALSNNLLSLAAGDDDIVGVVNALNADANCENVISVGKNIGFSIFNHTTKTDIAVENLWNNVEFDLLFTLIKAAPKRIIFEEVYPSKPLLNTLSRLTQVTL